MSFLEIMQDVLKSKSISVLEIAPPTPWRSAWRELAAIASEITTQDDPRFHGVMQALDSCADADHANDWTAFHQAALTVRRAIE